MFGHYEYGSQHTVGGSSSQPNVVDSSSLTEHFSLADDDFTEMYSPQFSESFREEQSPIKEVGEIQVSVPKKKLN
nr:hypothetical protein [Tanacetum cinerariifolium]